MQDQIQDAIKRPGGVTYGDEGSGGSGGTGRGGGGHGPGAGSGMTILSDLQGWDPKSYMNRLHAIVMRNWTAVLPESYYMGDKGIVVITFTINRDGTIHVDEPTLDRTSGKEALDRAVMAAIRTSVPFEPLPPDYKGDSLQLRGAFYYNIQPNSGQ
jgi:TonB family protein